MNAVPLFLEAQAMPETLATQISYAAHDRSAHAEGKTGLALVAGVAKRIAMESGRAPSAFVLEARPSLGHPAAPDGNFQLMTESLSLFGLPMQIAAHHTHLGLCGACLDYPLLSVGSVAGVALCLNFERSEPTT